MLAQQAVLNSVCACTYICMYNSLLICGSVYTYVCTGMYICMWQAFMIYACILLSRVFHLSPKFRGQTSLLEPWYLVKYNVRRIELSTLEQWVLTGVKEGLQLPSTNEYAPTCTTLVPPPISNKFRVSDSYLLKVRLGMKSCMHSRVLCIILDSSLHGTTYICTHIQVYSGILQASHTMYRTYVHKRA